MSTWCCSLPRSTSSKRCGIQFLTFSNPSASSVVAIFTCIRLHVRRQLLTCTEIVAFLPGTPSPLSTQPASPHQPWAPSRPRWICTGSPSCICRSDSRCRLFVAVEGHTSQLLPYVPRPCAWIHSSAFVTLNLAAPFRDPDNHHRATCVAVASASKTLSGSSNPAVQLCKREVDELTDFGFGRWCLVATRFLKRDREPCSMALCYHIFPKSFHNTHNRKNTTVLAKPLNFRPKLSPLIHDQKLHSRLVFPARYVGCLEFFFTGDAATDLVTVRAETHDVPRSR